jgi:hypothetical protein
MICDAEAWIWFTASLFNLFNSRQALEHVAD